MNHETTSAHGTRRHGSSLRRFVTPSLCLLLAACTPTEKVTRYKPFFSGIAEADFGEQKPVNPDAGRADPTLRNAEMKNFIEKPDGSKVYFTYVPMQLFINLETLLDEGTPEADKTILDQLIDEHTKEHYRNHSQDPIGYIAYLHENRKQLAKTFARMPMGEHTPTVIVEQPGDRQWVLNLSGQAGEGVKFRQVWIRQDMGQWKLEWLR